MSKNVFLTIDVEPDCPPYLTTRYGIEYGMPKLLNLFKCEGVVATFFITGQIAIEYPELIKQIVMDGHEIGCHGHTHHRFDQMSYQQAEYEIITATNVLRKYADIISFRAPYLRFPDEYLPILIAQEYKIDSSITGYKRVHHRYLEMENIHRLKISLRCTCFRLPFFLSKMGLKKFDQLVLFMHPWEFIDMTKEKIPLDCKFNTGNYTYESLKAWIRFLKKNDYGFLKCQDLLISNSLNFL